MPRTGRSIAIGERELQVVVDRLSAIYESTTQPEHAAPAQWGLTVVWCIGETLAACGGYDLMWLVYQMIEERCGRACAAWLDRAWEGVTVPGVVLWTTEPSEQSNR